MNTEAQTQNAGHEITQPKRIVRGEGVVGYAVLGCLAVGTIGIYKALWMEGVAAAACLTASLLAFGMVCHLYFRKD